MSRKPDRMPNAFMAANKGVCKDKFGDHHVRSLFLAQLPKHRVRESRHGSEKPWKPPVVLKLRKHGDTPHSTTKTLVNVRVNRNP